MNLVGKFFVMLILVMSVVFMALAMAVYSSHRNWHDDYQALQTDLNAVQTEVSNLQETKRRLETTLNQEQLYYEQQIAKLTTEQIELQDQLAQGQAELAQLRQREAQLDAEVLAATENMSQLLADVNALRAEINSAQVQRDEAYSGFVAATNELHTRLGELENASEQNRQLSRQVADYMALLDQNGIDPLASPDGVAPRVSGQVVSVLQGRIELSIGTDDGVRSGQTVQVYRENRYLGQARVVNARPDRAVAEMDRNFQQGVVQVGDRVATRL